MINFAGGIFLLGGGSLMRSDFDCLENCYLVVGERTYGWGGGQKFGGGSLLGGISPGSGERANFWLVGVGGGLPPSLQ